MEAQKNTEEIIDKDKKVMEISQIPTEYNITTPDTNIGYPQ